jgi:mannitol/fructose-specific phosphotransferase system IIA component (Ntr-type)/galactitol-specific phosphotransferase system IIB component
MLKKSETLLDVSLVHDDVLVKSLALHIKTLINRLENNLPINNPYLNTIKTEYPMVFEAAIYGYETMKEKYGFAYNDHEIAYIAMYIQAAIERSNSMKPRLKKRILIVCSSGIGTAQLVTSKFKRLFKDTEVVNTTSLLELDKINKKEIDLIVSTFSIDHTEVPCVSVSPFLNDKDIQRIETALEKTKTSETQMPFKGFTRLLDKRFLKVHSRHTDYNRLLKSMIDVLTRESRVTEKFHETVLKREALSSTAILDVTIPHGDYKEVIQDTMMVWTLSKPIKYGSSNIKIVIMLALRKETTKSLQSFYDSLYAIIDNGNIKEKILKVKDKESLYMTLFKGDKPS